MDVTGISETVAALVTTGRRLYEATKKMSDAETKNLIADLNLQIADLKSRVVDLQEENRRLQADLKQRSDLSSLRETLQVRNQVYYFREPVAGRPSGPYCPRCLDADERLVLVTEFKPPFTALGKFNCPNCKAVY